MNTVVFDGTGGIELETVKCGSHWSLAEPSSRFQTDCNRCRIATLEAGVKALGAKLKKIAAIASTTQQVSEIKE